MGLIVNKSWGQEDIIIHNGLYCGKILTVQPYGIASSVNYHKLKTKTFYVLSGTLYLQLCDETGKVLTQFTLATENTYTITPLTPHRFYTMGTECRFLEFSTHDDPEDSYRIIPSGSLHEIEMM